jgi:hypothetical protein
MHHLLPKGLHSPKTTSPQKRKGKVIKPQLTALFLPVIQFDIPNHVKLKSYHKKATKSLSPEDYF